MNLEKIEVVEELTHKEFYLVVNYYDGNQPYVSLSENPNWASTVDKIYKIQVPYKHILNK